MQENDGHSSQMENYNQFFIDLNIADIFNKESLKNDGSHVSLDEPWAAGMGGASIAQVISERFDGPNSYINRSIELGPRFQGLESDVAITLQSPYIPGRLKKEFIALSIPVVGNRLLDLWTRNEAEPVQVISFQCYGTMGITPQPQGEIDLTLSSDGKHRIQVNKEEVNLTDNMDEYSKARGMILKFYGIDIGDSENINVKGVINSVWHLIAQERRKETEQT